MKVMILGSGVIGVSLAYVLASRGHEVKVIERGVKSGAETSFANGGQLSYSHAEPWANPHVLPKLPGWLTRSDSPLIFRMRFDPEMMRFGIAFLRNCTGARAMLHAEQLLRLGLYSRTKMQALVAETGIEFDYVERGIVHIFDNQKELDYAAHQAEFQRGFGCEEKVLTRAEALALEPALAHSARPLVGGVHSVMDASGDAHLFCLELSRYCAEKLGVRFHYETSIEALVAERGKIVEVRTNKGTYRADAYVMALGSYSPLYARQVGIRLPIYPMKGYSVTIPADAYTPQVSVTDGSHKIVFSRLGDRLRVAGTAEFAGYNTRLIGERILPIVKAARSLFPKADWDNPTASWACLRPSTPSGPPLLGHTPLENLYLDTGHGTLGWTQAAGSAHIVADIIEQKQPEIDLAGLTLRG